MDKLKTFYNANKTIVQVCAAAAIALLIWWKAKK